MLRENGLASEDLEGYRLIAELSSSTYSHSFLGESIFSALSGEQVVIRFLSTTQTQQQNILQEIKSLQQLHHPHILPILSVGIDKERPYLITEYVPSGSLHERLQNRSSGQPMALEEASPLLAQMGEALHYAHRRQVIHGGLKPQNVLFDRVGNVLLTDFRLHTLLSSEKTSGANASEASIYLAPEQLAGHVSEKSDQYALGCLAYEMLTGSKAFMIPSVNTPGKYYRTKSLVMPGLLNPALSLRIEKAILKAMSRDPDQRYRDVLAFLAALEIHPVVEDGGGEKAATTFNREEKAAQEAALVLGPEIVQDPSVTLVRVKAQEAVVTLVPAMIQEAAVTPIPDLIQEAAVTPIPMVETVVAEKVDGFQEEVTIKEVQLSTADNDILRSSLGIIRPAKLRVSPSPASWLTDTIGRKFPFNKSGKKLASAQRLTFIAIFCLVITVIGVMGALFFPFSLLNASRGLGATPATYTTVIVPSPEQSGTPATGVSTTSQPTYGLTVSPQNPTPTQISVPAQGVVPAHGTSDNPNSQTIPTAEPKAEPKLTPEPKPEPTPTPAPTLVQVPLSSFFNNEGIGNVPGQANFDGSSFSYPASQLPSGGSITINGVPYQFPASGPSANDNVITYGQTVPLTPGHYQQMRFLMSATWGPATGTVTVEYDDGSRSTASITVSDWIIGQLNGLRTSYRYSPNAIDKNVSYIYVITIGVDSTRTATALVLPGKLSGPYQNARLHMFALTALP